MTHSKRYLKLYEDLYDGEAWIDSTIMDTISGLTARQAAKRVSPEWNTIWEIVNHMISWRMYVIGRLEGKPLKVQGNNFIKPVRDKSAKAWKRTLARLAKSQEKWTALLKQFKDKDLNKVHPNVIRSYSYLFDAILMHDTYHLGQLVLLVKKV